MLCPEGFVVVNLHYQMVQIGMLFEYYQYLESLFGQKSGYLTPPPGDRIHDNLPCFTINFEEMSSCIVLFIVHTN